MTLRHTGFAFEISNMVGVPLHLATERQWSVLSTVICMCGCLFRHVRICAKCEARSSDAVKRSWLSLVYVLRPN